MKKRWVSFILAVCMMVLGIIGLTACNDEPTSATPQKLSAPVITLTDDVASWEADSNADKFEISLDGNLSYVENTVTEKTLTNGQTLKVRAVGDGNNYSTSDWSNSVTYTVNVPAPQPTKLATPTVTVSDTGLASWTAVANASGYVYKIDSGAETPTGATSVQLTDGQSVVVKAVGDAVNYTDSDWSNSVTYTASVPAPQPTKLATPTVTVSDTGLASWTAVANASGYVYKIDSGAETPTGATSVQLTDGQSIVVKAVGDGTNYTDSDWSNSVTYTVSVPAPQPTKLATPTVTVSDTGLASWTAVANASGYVYKIDSGAETPTGATSVQLTDGQSIVVKAVGDGTNYTDSDWSNSVTYTASVPAPTNAPTYLGIVASTEEPTSNDVPSGLALLPMRAYSTRISLEEALRNYLSDSNNSLGDTPPTESGYEVYSSIGNTVYVQIWLDNPDQNTILSLKLNGTKYQSGGALQSFFIQDGDSYLNCVYVAITIPTGSYNQVAYEVTEIEYVEGTNINQDGKAVLIDEDNDTVLIGLPYEQAMPTASISNANSTATSISFDVTVADEDDFVNLVDGWLRVVVYNQSNEILAQEKLTNGTNTVTFNNLSADTYYNVMAFVLGDIHDGNGVYVYSLNEQTYKTESVITASITSGILQNEQTGKYYPVINVEAELGDASFTFTKVEVCEWDYDIYEWKVLYTDEEFDGSANITEGLLNGKNYTVKVYYENVSGVEQSYQDSVYVERLDYPWILEPCLQYGLIDDAILGFDFGDNKSNFDNLTIKIIDEYSKQYLAQDAIYLLDNPNAVAELEAQWQEYAEGWEEIYDRWYKLDNAQTKINDYYPDVQKAEWQAELDKGIYSYEYVYGRDEEFFKVGNKYYVILDGYQSQRVNGSSWKYTLSADFDLNDGEGVEQGRNIIDGWFAVKPAIGKNDYLFAEQFTLDDENVVYLETKSRNNLGEESYRELGYVNQIVLADGYDILHVLWSQDEPNHDIDEAAWLAAIKNALLAGEDVHSVFPLGELEPITIDLDDIQFNSDIVGNFYIRYTYIMYGKEYSSENPYDWDGQVIDYTVKGTLPQVTIDFATGVEQFGMWSISSPDWVKNGVWNFSYSIEVRDENQQVVGTYTQDNYGEYERLPLNYSIRVRLDSYVGADYYTQGEWSEWFTCLPIKLQAPETFTQSFETDGVKLEWNGVDGAEKFVYVISNGEETETSGASVSGLKNGDTVKVKAVPAADSNYAESDYSEIFTVADARTQLATPTNITGMDKMLFWQEVENATYYEIEFLQNDAPYIATSSYPEYYATIGKSYRIRACNEDLENYKASEWSEAYLYTVTLENPTFNQIRSERVYWNRVEYAQGYNYKVGENGEVLSTSRYYVALADIPLGEKLYVQAYADGCESTEWVMIYHNVTVLATPSVTVSGGTATWDAIENATGYVYKINDGAEQSTTETSVSGLVVGDRIVVRAASAQIGYTDSEWSEEKTQLPTMSAPVLDVSLFASEGTISWGAVDGASAYEYEIDGNANTFAEMSVSNIEFGQSFKVRAVCDNGVYEQYGEWSELVVRVDTREQLAMPVIAYDLETGLTVVANDSNVSCYEVMFGQDGLITYHYPTGSGGTEVITQSFTFLSGENTVYVRAIPVDKLNYRESEWATLAIIFE